MPKEIPDQNGGGGEFAPTAMIREKGAMLKGVLVGVREVKTQWGPRPVYNFKVLDANCKFMKDKTEVQPAEGDAIDVFAPTRLARQLAHVNQGETVTIEYQGTKKLSKGMPAHTFKVVVE